MTSRSLKTWARLLGFGIFFFVFAAPGRAQDADRKVIKRVEPEYPPMMKRLEIGGTVRLRVTVKADGNVESVDTLGGNDGLAAAAVKAVQQWKFSPASHSTTVAIKLVFDPHR
jgi:TonB family protein